jgi:hypothetical protein
MPDNRADHDILIEVAANLNSLCSKIDKVDKDNKEEHKDIRTMINENFKNVVTAETTYQKEAKIQVDACNSRFLQTKVFLWVMGFVIAGVIGAYSFTSYVHADLNKHRIQDAKVMNEFQNHLEKLGIHNGVNNVKR